MLTDLVQIRRLGEKKRDENLDFRHYLKRHVFVERRFRAIAEEIEEEIDCRQCANCCRVATTKLQERDIEKLARFLRVKRAQFIRDYTTVSEDEGIVLKRTEEHGCIFLSGNECTVYEARPSTCEHFPHVVRGAGSITSRMWQFVDRATYCPIVYNWMESVKKETNFRPAP
jgi:Fe-S-cluster containining protein